MEIGDCDRGGYRESNTAAQKCSQTISNGKPVDFRSDQNSRTDAGHSSDDCSGQ